MAFPARLFIQGVGVNRVSDDGKRLEAYFPTNAAAVDFELLNAARLPVNERLAGQMTPICEHHAFVQFSAKNLDPSNADICVTVMLDREFVEVMAGGAGVLPLEVGASGRVEDMASMQDLLGGLADARQLRSDLAGHRSRLLHAEVHVPCGRAKGFKPRRWSLFDGDEDPVRMSGALQIELGDVDTLALRITAFDNSASRTLMLHPKPPFDDFDIWIRHFCSFERPDSYPPILLEEGDTDPDFILNYALIEGVGKLSKEQKAKLPIPFVPEGSGGPIGGNHGICMGAAS